MTLIDALDLVITIDTSVAHLAGALGKPVWVLLQRNPAWCWMLAAVVVGVRQALDYRQTGHAVLVCLIGWLVAFTLTAGAGLLLTTAAH